MTWRGSSEEQLLFEGTEENTEKLKSFSFSDMMLEIVIAKNLSCYLVSMWMVAEKDFIKFSRRENLITFIMICMQVKLMTLIYEMLSCFDILDCISFLASY